MLIERHAKPRSTTVRIGDRSPCEYAGMVIAFAECVLEAGFTLEQRLWVSCTDIDNVAASMAYIQLSLLGIPGQVITGNLLTLECRRVLFTPAHYSGN